MVDSHNVVRIKGTLPGGESWSVNPAFRVPGVVVGSGSVTTYDDLAAWASAIGNAEVDQVFPDNLQNRLSTVCLVTAIRTEYWDENGDMTEAAEYSMPVPAAGTSAPNMPLQTAIVSSLKTGRPGRSYRGRLYWPCLSINLNATTLRVSTADIGEFATAVASWLHDTAILGQVHMPALAPCVYSPTLGVASEIITVSVGDVLDTQRRRRDKAIETYSSASIGL